MEELAWPSVSIIHCSCSYIKILFLGHSSWLEELSHPTPSTIQHSLLQCSQIGSFLPRFVSPGEDSHQKGHLRARRKDV